MARKLTRFADLNKPIVKRAEGARSHALQRVGDASVFDAFPRSGERGYPNRVVTKFQSEYLHETPQAAYEPSRTNTARTRCASVAPSAGSGRRHRNCGGRSGGVFAGGELVRAGLTAIGLEARNRIGGRIFTRRTLARHPIELGAEFVHGTDNIIHRLVTEYGLTLVPHAGDAYSWWDGKMVLDSQLPRPPLDALHEIRSLADRLRRSGQGNMPLPEFLKAPELSSILSRSAVTQRYIEQLIKNYHSVEPTALTLEGWLEPDVTGFEANFRIAEGYSTPAAPARGGRPARHSPQATGSTD